MEFSATEFPADTAGGWLLLPPPSTGEQKGILGWVVAMPKENIHQEMPLSTQTLVHACPQHTYKKSAR